MVLRTYTPSDLIYITCAILECVVQFYINLIPFLYKRVTTATSKSNLCKLTYIIIDIQLAVTSQVICVVSSLV